jgi:hypothetical protein
MCRRIGICLLDFPVARSQKEIVRQRKRERSLAVMLGCGEIPHTVYTWDMSNPQSQVICRGQCNCAASVHVMIDHLCLRRYTCPLDSIYIGDTGMIAIRVRRHSIIPTHQLRAYLQANHFGTLKHGVVRD